MGRPLLWETFASRSLAFIRVHWRLKSQPDTSQKSSRGPEPPHPLRCSLFALFAFFAVNSRGLPRERSPADRSLCNAVVTWPSPSRNRNDRDGQVTIV